MADILSMMRGNVKKRNVERGKQEAYSSGFSEGKDTSGIQGLGGGKTGYGARQSPMRQKKQNVKKGSFVPKTPSIPKSTKKEVAPHEMNSGMKDFTQKYRETLKMEGFLKSRIASRAGAQAKDTELLRQLQVGMQSMVKAAEQNILNTSDAVDSQEEVF
jgi:hypothetical protein